MEIGAILRRNTPQWQQQLLRTWRGIRRGTRHADERDVFIRGELLDEVDCTEELRQVIELELDEPTLALLSPVTVFFEQALDKVWYAT